MFPASRYLASHSVKLGKCSCCVLVSGNHGTELCLFPVRRYVASNCTEFGKCWCQAQPISSKSQRRASLMFASAPRISGESSCRAWKMSVHGEQLCCESFLWRFADVCGQSLDLLWVTERHSFTGNQFLVLSEHFRLRHAIGSHAGIY